MPQRRSSKKAVSQAKTRSATSELPEYYLFPSDCTETTSSFQVLAESKEAKRYADRNRNYIDDSYKNAVKVMKKLRTAIRKGHYGKVTGIGVEYFHVRGLIVMPPQYCVTVWVEEKTLPQPLRQDLGIKSFAKRPSKTRPLEFPKSIDGVRIKVSEANPVHAGSGLHGIFADGGSDPPIDTAATIIGGIAISNDGIKKWGTLGIVFPTTKGSRAMSCEHVVTGKGSTVVQPPFKSASLGGNPRNIGSVSIAKNLTVAGADVSLIKPGNVAVSDGILEMEKYASEIMILTEHANDWQRLVQGSVLLYGARTAAVKSGEIKTTLQEVEVKGRRYTDCILVHANPSSSAIVDSGDSGSALLYQAPDGTLVWIGIVFAMVSPFQLAACKLTNCFDACGLTATDIPKKLRRSINDIS